MHKIIKNSEGIVVKEIIVPDNVNYEKLQKIRKNVIPTTLDKNIDKWVKENQELAEKEMEKIKNLFKYEPDTIQLIWDSVHQYYCTKEEWFEQQMMSWPKIERRPLNKKM